MLTCCDEGVGWCLCMLNGAVVTFVLPFSLGFCLLKPRSGSYSVVCHAITPRRGSLVGSLGGCAASRTRRCTWRWRCYCLLDALYLYWRDIWVRQGGVQTSRAVLATAIF